MPCSGSADLFLGRLKSASDRLRKSVEINPNVAMPHFFLAAASALSGRAAEAREARIAGLQLDPNFTVARFRNERRSDNPAFLGQRERIYEGLSLAGVPEEAPYHLALQIGLLSGKGPLLKRMESNHLSSSGEGVLPLHLCTLLDLVQQKCCISRAKW
jgi:hypothetical protein